MFYGLFVGIDLYTPPITRLSCARRDADSLAALFSDSLAGRHVVLTDHDATLSNIDTALVDLGRVDPEDLVIVSFSGHGTPNHNLVPVDADVDNPESTMLHLDKMAARLDDVPARDLFVILDCCFSGGFGGERSFAPARERQLFEDRASLDRLGHGRVVITASGAAEPALETIQLGHGLLTHYLLEALQGPPSLDTDPQIPLHSLLQYVVRRVIDKAEAIGAIQTPTVYSSLQGEAQLPRLTPGAAWAELYPDQALAPATKDWDSLEPYGLPPFALQRWAAAMPAGLNDLQLAAINDYGLLDGRNLVVVAPTSSGKTMIGEVAGIAAAAKGGRAVFLLPLKALVNDKYNALRSVYGNELTVIRATGDHSDQIDDLLGGHYDMALLTYEKFTALVLGQPHIMRGVDVVVVDEAQMITDPHRGANLEFALTLLRRGYGSTSPAQLIALSAVTGDTAGLERWLNAELLVTDRRPVPLIESVIDSAGRRRSLNADGTEVTEPGYVTPQYGRGSQTSKPWIIGLVRRLVKEGKKVIVFRNWRRKTVATASYLAEALRLDAAEDALAALPTADAGVSSDTLRRVLEGGVAFHNSDLEPIERSTVETEFRDPQSSLRVVVATTTLAMGINTPAEAVVIEGLDYSRNHPYSVADYKNMVGRAGRLGHVDAGESYLLATGDLSPHRAWNHYVKGAPEPVLSRLLDSGTDPRTILLRALVALGGSASLDDLVGLVDSSFAVWQMRSGHQTRPGWTSADLDRSAQGLLNAGFLDHDPNDAVAVTALGRFAGESGIQVTSLIRLSHVLGRLSRVGAADLVTLAQITVELDERRIPTNSRSVQERNRWRFFLARQGVQPTVITSLHIEGGDSILRAKRAAAALFYISDTPIREAEAHLLQHVRESSASGDIRAIASRSHDVLDAVATVASLRAGLDCAETSDELAIRLQFGIPTEMVALADTYGDSLTRGEYLALQRAGLLDTAAIETASDDDLAELLTPAAFAQVRGVFQ